MDLKEEDILGHDISKHWYYRSKLAALLRYVMHLAPRKVLDVGAGSGFFSKGLLDQTEAQEALCVDTGYSSEKEEFVNGKSVQFRTGCGQTEADLVLMMDVLEHVDDDVGLLAEYVNRAGLSVESSSYYYGLIFPLAATTRLIGKLFSQQNNPPRSQLKQHHTIVNKILTYLCSVDLSILRRNRLAGLTVFCLAQKP